MEPIKSRHSVLSRIGKYLTALDRRGLVLAAISALPGALDIITPFITDKFRIPPWVAVLWYCFFFGWANLRLFERIAGSDLEFQPRDHYVALTEWFESDRKTFSVGSEFTITLHVNTSITNHTQRAIFVKMSVLSVNSDWESAIPLSECVVRVDRPQPSGRPGRNNPFPLAGGEILDAVHIGAAIPFRAPDRDKVLEHLASLSQLSITLGAEQGGHQPLPLEFDCDVSSIHKTIEDELTNRIRHSDTESLRVCVLEHLRRFWQSK